MSILQPWLWFDIVPVVMRFAVALLLIIACSEQPRDTSPTRLSEAAPAKPDAISKSPSLEKTLGSFLQEGIPSVAVLELGSYQSLAVMRIVPTNRNRSEIQCELFYLKHGKKLVASGVWDSAAGVIKCSESYMGKPTGYFEISTNDPDKSFWSRSKGSTKEPAALTHVCKMNAVGRHLLSRHVFRRVHKTQDASNGELHDVEDTVWIARLPDNSVAFKINVVGGNFHLGAWAGIAFPNSDGKSYRHESGDHSDRCILTILLSDGKHAEFRDVECSSCCGNRATLDGVYPFKSADYPLGKN